MVTAGAAVERAIKFMQDWAGRDGPLYTNDIADVCDPLRESVASLSALLSAAETRQTELENTLREIADSWDLSAERALGIRLNKATNPSTREQDRAAVWRGSARELREALASAVLREENGT